MDYVQEDNKKGIGEIRMLKSVIARVLPRLGFKAMILQVGELAVQISRNETDDKVWDKAKKFIEKL